MRHSAAHSLARKGNHSKQISVFLGHKSVQITNDVYLRDTPEQVCEGMVLPEHWNGEPAMCSTNKNTTEGPPSKKKRSKGTSTKDIFEKAMAMLQNV